MDLDRVPLWSERGDVAVGALWSAYANYPYLPRLASLDVLCNAISDGTSQMNWASETFAYAEAHNDDTWVGVHTAEHVNPQRSGWLVHPDAVPDEGADEVGDGAQDRAAGAGAEGSGVEGAGATTKGGPAKTQFYARFDLDRVRAIRQLEDILTNVMNHLEGSAVSLTVEVNARTPRPEGYDDRTRRVVTENATQLGADSAEFE